MDADLERWRCSDRTGKTSPLTRWPRSGRGYLGSNHGPLCSEFEWKPDPFSPCQPKTNGLNTNYEFPLDCLLMEIAAGNAGWRLLFPDCVGIYAGWSRVPELWTLDHVTRHE